MAEIKLEYNNTRTVISFVDDWNALTKDQLFYIAENWQLWKAVALENKSLILAKAAILLRLLTGTKKEIKKQALQLKSLTGEELYDCVQVSNFIFEKNTLTNCPLPIVRVGLKKFYAPNNSLSNITGFEFSFADLNFMKYHNSGNEEHLNNLIATIYRPGVSVFNKTGEKRVTFNHKLIETYAKKIKKLSYAEKQLILIWFMGCRQQIIDENKSVFTGENQQKSEVSGWISVIMALSGDRFGTFEQTGHTDLSLIFLHLRQLNAQKPKKQATT